MDKLGITGLIQRGFGATSGPGSAASASARNACFVMGDEAAGDERADDGGDQRGDADRAGVMLEGEAEEIAAEPEDASPRRCRRAR